MADGSQTFVGTVTSFNAQKGWGFIDSEASKALFGKDVFLLRSALGGYCAQVGDQVSFTATIGERGGPQAANVKPLASDDATFYGEIKTWNPAKGFGFITSSASDAMYGKDIFVLKSVFGTSLDGVAPGVPLTFKVKNEERGPVAYEARLLQQGAAGIRPTGGNGMMGIVGMQQPLQFMQPPPAPNRGGPPFGQPQMGAYGPQRSAVVGGGKGMGKGMGKPGQRVAFLQQPQQMAMIQQVGAWGPAMGGAYATPGPFVPAVQSRPQRSPGENDVFFGTIKSVNLEKGWGHIDCQATNKLYGKDMFVMKSGFENVVVNQGDQVAFNVAQGPKGPHATNLRVLGVSPQQVYAGTVKSYCTGKGWGFCDSAESKATFGVDVFMHSKDFAPGMAAPSIGDPMQFTVNISNGRAVAKEIQPLGGEAPGADHRFSPY